MKALVIGGGGPTGPAIVSGLKARGYAVTTLSRGVHPVDHGPGVEQIKADPHFAEPGDPLAELHRDDPHRHRSFGAGFQLGHLPAVR